MPRWSTRSAFATTSSVWPRRARPTLTTAWAARSRSRPAPTPACAAYRSERPARTSTCSTSWRRPGRSVVLAARRLRFRPGVRRACRSAPARACERILEEGDALVACPAAFRTLGALLAGLDRVALERDAAALERPLAELPHAERAAARHALDALGMREGVRTALATSGSDLRRRLHTWFDALRTLQALHRLRDAGLADVPFRAALAHAPFSPELRGDETDLERVLGELRGRETELPSVLGPALYSPARPEIRPRFAETEPAGIGSKTRNRCLVRGQPYAGWCRCSWSQSAPARCSGPSTPVTCSRFRCRRSAGRSSATSASIPSASATRRAPWPA